MSQPEGEAANDWGEDIRARALAHARSRESRGSRAPRMVAIAVAVLLHLFAAVCLYLLMQPHPILDEGRIEVRLLDAAPSEPALPEPPPMPFANARVEPAKRTPARTVPQTNSPSSSSISPAAKAERSTDFDTVTLFNADGAVRMPIAPAAPKSTPHEEAIQRGREMMARGLDCEAHGTDDLAHRESVGEEVARKYLSWIGLYNPAAAQRRAEEEEKRQTRCRMWK